MAMLVCALMLALVPGEKLTYDVRFGPMSVGSLELTTLAPDTLRGEDCHRFRATIELSLPVVFRARYVHDAWVTTDEFMTLRSSKLTEETRYRAQWTAEYLDSLVIYSDGDTHRVAEQSRDLLTSWQYLRTLDPAASDTVRFLAHSDRRTQEVAVVAREHGTVRTAAGSFRTRELAQLGTGLVGTMFRSDDEQRLPVLIRTVFAGVPITAQLRKVASGAGP